MKLAFTICSNNYLAHAKSLGDSLLKHNPGYHFAIILVDRRSTEIDYGFFHPYEIITVEELGIPDFESIWRKYNIVELNTAVKPSVFKYLFNKFPDAGNAFYFDPDILIYDPITDLENEFQVSDVLLTPHILTPMEYGPIKVVPSENTFLNFGLYNLGFLGLKNGSVVTRRLLDWWESRTLEYGYINMKDGFFVDQLWMNLVPIYFDKVRILREMGYNMAPWNLHERGQLIRLNGKYLLPDSSRLIFYHFSSYKFNEPDNMARHYDRFNFANSPAVKPLYEEYHDLLLANRIQAFSKVPCFFVKSREAYLEELKKEARKKGWIKRMLKAITPPVFVKGIKRLYAVVF
jgi:hypothetical protein